MTPRESRDLVPGGDQVPRKVAVVGLGYWGPNLARNFDLLAETELSWICDASEPARERWTPQFPNARVTADLDDLLNDDELDAERAALVEPIVRAILGDRLF